MSIVVITSKERFADDFQGVMEKANFFLKPNKLVLIKPNACGMYPPSLALLEAIVKALKPFSDSIIIGETPSAIHTPEERFASLGIDVMAKRLGVMAYNLMKDQIIIKEVPRPHTIKKIPFPSKVLQADLLINCPGLGKHGNTLLTCALKNLFGLVAETHKYSSLHPLGVSEVIADIFQVVKPHLNIVDCGSRVIGGIDALSVDIVAAEIIGLNVKNVRHLVLAAQDVGLNIGDLKPKLVEYF
jgi:uncharacterized protein (DUF362 family)